MLSINLIRILTQARLLFASVPPQRAALHAGRALATSGAVHVSDGLSVAGGQEVGLWKHVAMSEDRDDGGSLTVATRETMATFGLEDGRGDVIWVGDYPTEVLGTVTASKRHRAGLFGTGSNMNERWLPVTPELTVIGRVEVGEHGLELRRDRWAGLLLSTQSPRGLAWRKIGEAVIVLIVLALLGWLGHTLV